MISRLLLTLVAVTLAGVANRNAHADDQLPDIVLMMADDLGFSDIGCYGSEIPTPHLDALAASGIRFSNFSNTSRCCPSRASLLTGQYSHRVGLGDMTYGNQGPGYRGQLSANFPTLPEILKQRGYATGMVGKWHLTRSETIDDGPNGSWPRQRGFDRFFGTMEGAKNYFRPTWLFDGSKEIKTFDDGFFYTDAISSRAADWITSQNKDKPLFLYTAFYAPHFPLQAPRDVIEKHRGHYLVGWDKLRSRRLEKQKALGIVPEQTSLSPRAKDIPAWKTLPQRQRDALDLRMATYAAQVEMLDRGVGRIVKALRESGRLNRTLVVFLSDNGGASSGGPFGVGETATVGTPDAPVKTTYGKGWATLSNTPFRMHKANTHEGGVMSPLILHWPARLGTAPSLRRDVAHIIDIAPTIVGSASGTDQDVRFAGIDLLATTRQENAPVFYEHQKSRAVRKGDWKLVNRDKTQNWELYNLRTDRTEQIDFARNETAKLESLKSLWLQWAKQHHVKTK